MHNAQKQRRHEQQQHILVQQLLQLHQLEIMKQFQDGQATESLLSISINNNGSSNNRKYNFGDVSVNSTRKNNNDNSNVNKFVHTRGNKYSHSCEMLNNLVASLTGQQNKIDGVNDNNSSLNIFSENNSVDIIVTIA